MRAMRRKEAVYTSDLIQQLEDFIEQKLVTISPYLMTVPQLRSTIKKEFRFNFSGHGPRDVEMEEDGTVIKKRDVEASEYDVDKEWLKKAMQNMLTKGIIIKGEGYKATSSELHAGGHNEAADSGRNHSDG